MKASPTVEEMPLDSLTAQIISCDATLVAVVVGLVLVSPLLRRDRGATDTVVATDEALGSLRDILVHKRREVGVVALHEGEDEGGFIYKCSTNRCAGRLITGVPDRV